MGLFSYSNFKLALYGYINSKWLKIPANIAVCRSYLSAATKLSERTKAVSMISLAQVLGFIFGPALQTAVVPLGNDGVWLIRDKLKLDMYTAVGWINVIFAIINFTLFLPAIFKEKKIAAKEAMQLQGVETEKETYKGQKPDYLSVWTLIVAFFVLVFNFMLLETLGTSLTMDQFAWSKAEALYYMGIIMSVGAIIAIFTFLLINPLCKFFPEVKVMIWGGFFFMVLGRVLFIPWGPDSPPIYDDSERLEMLHNKSICDNFNSNLTKFYDCLSSIPRENETSPDFRETFRDFWEFKNAFSIYCNQSDIFDYLETTGFWRNGTKVSRKNCDDVPELVGCPSSQEWCFTTPGMTMTQFIIGYALTALGYPIGVTLIQTIFSKILGPRPQVSYF